MAKKIVFVSNYINHHQIPVSDELYRLTDGSYVFIQTEPMEEERVKMGWDVNALNKPYVKLFYEDEFECKSLIMESDCVIFGGTEKEELILPRLEANKLTIRYSERLYKDGRWKFISPRGLKKKYHDHVRFNKSNVYLLCSGAYVKGDFSLIHAYPGKTLKYGYFPEFIEYKNLHEIRENNKAVNILWAARFIDWKHPDMMVKLADMLANAGVEATVTMIGGGELLNPAKHMASTYEFETDNELESFKKYTKGKVKLIFAGNMAPEKVRDAMRKADIFISTSDRKEGWGAVVNEAMNSGCVTIASKEIGAAPYLIKNGENGFMIKSCDTKALFDTVINLLYDSDKRKWLGNNAYETIKNTWNAKEAAKRLVAFINDTEKNLDRYQEGPLSRA